MCDDVILPFAHSSNPRFFVCPELCLLSVLSHEVAAVMCGNVKWPGEKKINPNSNEMRSLWIARTSILALMLILKIRKLTRDDGSGISLSYEHL